MFFGTFFFSSGHDPGASLRMYGGQFEFLVGYSAVEPTVEKLHETTQSVLTDNPGCSVEVCFEGLHFDDQTVAAAIRFLSGLQLQTLQVRRCTGRLDLLVASAFAMHSRVIEEFTIGFSTSFSNDETTRVLQSVGIGMAVAVRFRSLALSTEREGSRFTMTEEAATSLATGLRSCSSSLFSFELVNCAFSGGGSVGELAKGLQSLPALNQLRIRGCVNSNRSVISDKNMWKIFRALGCNDKSTLWYLNLEGRHCSGATLEALSRLLETSPNLSRLDLRNYNPSRRDQPPGTALFSSIASHACSLTDLNLSSCELLDTQMAYVATMLCHCKSIRTLGISRNRITRVGVSILASRCREWKTLQSLVIGDILLSPDSDEDNETLEEFADALEGNLTMREVRFDSWVITRHPRIRYFCDLNACGRSEFLAAEGAAPPPGFFPRFFARANHVAKQINLFAREDPTETRSRAADIIFFALRRAPAFALGHRSKGS